MKDSEIRALALAGAKSGEFKIDAWPHAEVQRTASGGAFVAVCVEVPPAYLNGRALDVVLAGRVAE